MPRDRGVSQARNAGLFVHIFTFRNEGTYLAADYNGDAQGEFLMFYRLGIDGVFNDFTNAGVTARATYLHELGR